MNKPDLSNVLSEAGGGTRRKPVPDAPEPQPRPKAVAASSRGALKPIQINAPAEVYKQIRTMGIEQDKNMHELLFEALNDLFTKYGKPELCPRGGQNS
jgi:antitoxin-like ribbon-helix-helix protein